MIRMTPTILAVGAAGPNAGLVVPELARRGAHVRGLIRDAGQRDQVMRRGAAEVVVGDLTDRASLDAALRGVDAVFYLAPAFLPDEANVGVGVVEAARRAGVRRLVFSSVIHPVLGELINHAAKVPVEDALLNSGLEYVILQPTLFMQNMAGSWPRVVQSGVYAEPWSSETRFSRVDYRDVAEVAALALTEDHLLYGTYQLCAEGTLDRHEVAALMSEVAGKPVRAARADPDGLGLPADSPMRAMFDWYDHHGLKGNALTLRAILGREPRTLRAYLEELSAHSAPVEPGR